MKIYLAGNMLKGEEEADYFKNRRLTYAEFFTFLIGLYVKMIFLEFLVLIVS